MAIDAEARIETQEQRIGDVEEMTEWLMSHPLLASEMSRPTAVWLAETYPESWIRGWMRTKQLERANSPVGLLRSKLKEIGAPPQEAMGPRVLRNRAGADSGAGGIRDGCLVQSVGGGLELAGRTASVEALERETREWIRGLRETKVDMTPMSGVIAEMPEWMKAMWETRSS